MNLKFKVTVFIVLLLAVLFTVSFKIAHYTPTPYKLVYDSTYFSAPAIPTHNPLTVEGVELGRLLFYDPLLSGNNTQSCGSCHKQEFSFSDGGKKLSTGAHGHLGKRNTMALVNLAWQKQYFWDGRSTMLEDLVLFPITDTLEMAQDTTSLVAEFKKHPNYPALFNKAFPGQKVTYKNAARALAQFLRTIVSRPLKVIFAENTAKYVSKYYSKPDIDSLYIRTGFNCAVCHLNKFSKVGDMANNFIDPTDSSYFNKTKVTGDVGRFKIPSLVNIKYTAPYMHNGNLTTSFEVINHYKKSLKNIQLVNDEIDTSQLDTTLTDFDTKNIDILFSLFTDTTILVNKKYANPFTSEDFNWKDYPNFK